MPGRKENDALWVHNRGMATPACEQPFPDSLAQDVGSSTKIDELDHHKAMCMQISTPAYYTCLGIGLPGKPLTFFFMG